MSKFVAVPSAVDSQSAHPRSPEDRPVTYQLTMRACDGMVIASDRRERLVSDTNYPYLGVPNHVCKVRLDLTGKYPWVFSGESLAPVLSRHLTRALSVNNAMSDAEVVEALERCHSPAYEEWHGNSSGRSDACIVLACGESKKIFRFRMLIDGEVEEQREGMVVSGQTFNLAAFLPIRYYSSKMTADELACLAAYSIRWAHDLDSAFVDGLDIAMYHDSTRKFEMMDSQLYWSKAEEIDAEMRRVLPGILSPKSPF